MEATLTGARQATHPWDGFLVGPENALARASVEALARGESEGISPLVLHGPAGAGKSRLLEALVAERLARWPGAAVAHLQAEQFAALCGEATGRVGGWAELRERFRALDLLVLEDVQALERARPALEELSHTLDALAEVGAAVAVSARVGPGQWAGWPARLVSRLVGGLAVRVEPPGLDTRRRYVLERSRSRGLVLAAEAVELLAASADGYRTLDGWLARMGLEARGKDKPLDGEDVATVLAEEGAIGDWSIERVARAVCERFGVRLRDVRSASRRQALVEPRHLAIHLARSWTGASFAAIGAYFGRRDPATIRHACRAAQKRLAEDPALAAVVAAIGRFHHGEHGEHGERE